MRVKPKLQVEGEWKDNNLMKLSGTNHASDHTSYSSREMEEGCFKKRSTSTGTFRVGTIYCSRERLYIHSVLFFFRKEWVLTCGYYHITDSHILYLRTTYPSAVVACLPVCLNDLPGRHRKANEGLTSIAFLANATTTTPLFIPPRTVPPMHDDAQQSSETKNLPFAPLNKISSFVGPTPPIELLVFFPFAAVDHKLLQLTFAFRIRNMVSIAGNTGWTL